MAAKHNTKATVKLNSGYDIPIVGMGAWTGLDPAEQAAAKNWLLNALKVGYRHIDTSSIYNTEQSINAAVKASGIPREELFLTTKMAFNGHQHVEQFFAKSLGNLGLEYLDLYLMHWPQCVVYDENNQMPMHPNGVMITTTETNFNESWARFEKLVETGKVRSIGVSNFSIKNLEKLLTTAKIVPAVNQVEIHPYLVQEELVKYCQSKGITVVGYTPTGKEKVRQDPLILELAEKYKSTPTQVILAWHLARDIVIIPKSADPQRQKENLDLPVLEAEDVKKISTLDRNDRLSMPEWEVAGTLCGWTYEQLGWEGHARGWVEGQ